MSDSRFELFVLAIIGLLLVIFIVLACSDHKLLVGFPRINRQMKQKAPKNTLAADKNAILQRLQNAKATLYGANWCSYTQKQLQELGLRENNTETLDYIECANDKARCSDEGIEAFPTWKIGSQYFPGFYTTDQLMEMLN